MVPLAVRDFLLVNHKGNKTDKQKRGETERQTGRRELREGDFLIF